jgi:hypothetical protein
MHVLRILQIHPSSQAVLERYAQSLSSEVTAALKDNSPTQQQRVYRSKLVKEKI